MNPEEAQGETIDDLANKVLKVSFPNKLFLSVEHSTKDLGLFSFEFYYSNRTQELGSLQELSSIYSLITEPTIIGKFISVQFLLNVLLNC